MEVVRRVLSPSRMVVSRDLALSEVDEEERSRRRADHYWSCCRGERERKKKKETRLLFLDGLPILGRRSGRGSRTTNPCRAVTKSGRDLTQISTPGRAATTLAIASQLPRPHQTSNNNAPHSFACPDPSIEVIMAARLLLQRVSCPTLIRLTG